MVSRGPRMTKTQKQILINYLEENKKMLSPKHSLADLPKVGEHWQTLANLLNGAKGAKKTVKQWKEAWNELKTNVRRKARENRFDIVGTGGGEKKAKELTDIEERIIQLISRIVVEGAPLVPEAGVAAENYMLESDNENVEKYVVETHVVSEDFVNLNENIEDVEDNSFISEDVQELPPEEYILVPANRAAQAENQSASENRPRPRPRPKIRRIQRRGNPLQQVLQLHESCLENVASSNSKIAQALVQLSASITRYGRNNSCGNHSAVFELRF